MEKDILWEIVYVNWYLRKKEPVFEEYELQISLIETINRLFPRAIRIKVEKELYPLYFDNAKVFNSFL